MKPRPLHRSLTFWAGILMMYFTVWSWVDSNMMISRISRGRFSAFHSNGMIHLQKTGHTVPAAAQREPLRESAPLFMPLIFCRGGSALETDIPLEEDAPYEERLRVYMSTEPSDTWVMVIPHWLILLAVALPWSFFLICRARRVRRAATQTF